MFGPVSYSNLYIKDNIFLFNLYIKDNIVNE